jgi:peptide/nickel transport system ATP-binding protein
MYLGRIVERGITESVLTRPRHPYTQALLAAVPNPDLDHPLDFELVCGGGFSDPALWPHPFTIRPGETRPEMTEVAPRHFVCMAADEGSQPLRAAS